MSRSPIKCYACGQDTRRQVAPGRLCVECGKPFWPKGKDPAYNQCDPCYRGYESRGGYEIA